MKGRVDRVAVVYAAGFLVAIVAANWLTQRYHFVPVAPGLEATAGTYAAGVTFTLRDGLQERVGRWWVVALIVVGACLSALVAPALAVASGVAFLVAELADFAVYTPLRDRSWDAAVWVSAAVGSVVDSVVFLWLAPFPVTVEAVVGQVVGKALWATGAAWLLVRRWR